VRKGTRFFGEKRLERRDLKVDKEESTGGVVGETNIIVCWIFSKGNRGCAMSRGKEIYRSM
jgi:hypothetical protein